MAESGQRLDGQLHRGGLSRAADGQVPDGDHAAGPTHATSERRGRRANRARRGGRDSRRPRPRACAPGRWGSPPPSRGRSASRDVHGARGPGYRIATDQIERLAHRAVARGHRLVPGVAQLQTQDRDRERAVGARAASSAASRTTSAAPPLSSSADRFAEVAGMRPEEHRFVPLRPGSSTLWPPMGHHAAAHEHDVGDGVELRELADRVEDHDGRHRLIACS